MRASDAEAIADPEVSQVVSRYRAVDPAGSRTAGVIRHTFDQIYDGRHTGRFSVEQLSKTEKTHIGSLIEINLRREFDDLFTDGISLDFSVDGIQIDCKYSQRFGGWMVPPEAFGKLLLVCTANDAQSEWSIGVIRATEERLNRSSNRDAKRTLSRASVFDVAWIHSAQELPENTLLHLEPEMTQHILAGHSGQERINRLLRSVTNRRISRATIATVAQQNDPMKRVRSNGGAATHLAKEGILVIGGTYKRHRMIAQDLGAVVPTKSEVVSLRVTLALPGDADTVLLDGRLWRRANDHEQLTIPAPSLPSTRQIAADTQP